MKDAFAEAVEELAPRFETLNTYSTTGHPARLRLLLLEDRAALRGPRRVRRRAERDPARAAGWTSPTTTSRRRRPRSTRRRSRAAEDHPPGLPVPRRLPVREGAAVVLPARGGPPAGDARAHADRPRVHDDPQPHDLLVRDRRPGVHDGLRVRRAGRLHAPDGRPCASRRRSKYTERDTPIFVGQKMTVRAALDRLDGAVGTSSEAAPAPDSARVAPSEPQLASHPA